MVEWNEHESWLLERLGHLQEWKRVAFTAACAERALPVYLAYVEHLDDNRRPGTEVDQVRLALAFVWRNLTDINRDSDESQK